MARIGEQMGSVAGIRRKLRALAAVIADPNATEAERINAAALKTRLEQRLRDTGVPTGDWTDLAFRLGKWARETDKFTFSATGKRNWTDNAFRLGKMLRKGYKRWLSE